MVCQLLPAIEFLRSLGFQGPQGGLRVQGLGVEGFGLRVSGLGVGFEGFGFRLGASVVLGPTGSGRLRFMLVLEVYGFQGLGLQGVIFGFRA